MRGKKIIAALLAGLLCTSALAGCGSKKDTSAENNGANTAQTTGDLQKVLDAGKLSIGYTLYEPMNYKDDSGEFTGFDTEFATAVCQELGVEPNFVEINWDSKVVELNSSAIDCIWNGMTITEELKQNIDISSPYVKNMQVVVIKDANKDTYTDIASLADAKLIAEAGSAGAKTIEEDETLSAAPLTTAPKQTDALLEVKAGTSDAAILDWTLAKHMIGEGTDFSDLMIIESIELAVEEYGIGFRKDSDLCTKVNEIIEKFKTDGTLQALADKYELNLAE